MSPILCDDPRKYDFDPAVLLCKKDQQANECLTKEQAGTLRKFYQTPKNDKGKVAYSYPMEFGSELDWPGFHVNESFAALEQWVEKAVVPRKLIFRREDKNGTVVRTRPAFPYPAWAKYKGSSSIDKAENFVSSLP